MNDNFDTLTTEKSSSVAATDAAAAAPRADVPAPSSVQLLSGRLRRHKITRIGLEFLDRCEDIHLKDLVIDDMDDHRRAKILGRTVMNFGSDSFLGLDRDERVQKALVEALPTWGTHNGASRAFSSVALCAEAERRLADWLGVEDTLIFPSVTLANVGLIPALAGAHDLVVVDRLAHDSIHEGVKIAKAEGSKVKKLSPCTAAELSNLLAKESRRGGLVALDGVYSMSGA